MSPLLQIDSSQHSAKTEEPVFLRRAYGQKADSP